MIKKADWLAIAKDRTAIILFLLLGLAGIVLFITTILRIHSSDIQLPARYTGYGLALIYREQWYAQLAYSGFTLLVLGVNSFLAIKLYQLQRLFGLGFLIMSIFLVIMCVVVANAIFNLAPTI